MGLSWRANDGLVGVVWAVRAAINSTDSGPPAWSAVGLAAAALLAVPAGAAAIYFLLPVPVSESTPVRSVERETGSAGLYSVSSCSERGEQRWRCEVADRSGSGLAHYTVSAGNRCWHARLTNDDFEGHMPARADGCTTLRDTVR